jgi:hypothetical protein
MTLTFLRSSYGTTVFGHERGPSVNIRAHLAILENLARWRQEFGELFKNVMNGREQFRAWVQEAAMLTADRDEARECLAAIKNDECLYWRAIAQLPDVYEFTIEELEKRNGKAAKLLGLAAELSRLQTSVERRLEKLHFLSEYPLQ